MSMHLRGSRDMMRNENEGWWVSRTGLEQKLIILSTVLFIVAFALAITTIVFKSGTCTATCEATVTDVKPTEALTTGDPVTGSPVTGSPVTGSPVTGSPVTGSPVTGSPATGSPVTGDVTTSPPQPSTGPTPSTVTSNPEEITFLPTFKPDSVNEQTAPLRKSIPLMSFLKEVNRVEAVLEKQKLAGA